MVRNYISEKPLRVFAWTLGGLLILLILIEGWRYSVKPNPPEREQQLQETLRDISDRFLNNQRLLLSQTQQLAQTLQTQLELQQPRGALFKSLQEYSQMWGAGLYQGTQPVVWNNFSLELFEISSVSNDAPSKVMVKKKNNVLYYIAYTNFVIQIQEGPAPYHLFSAQRIKQSNALPIGDSEEFSLLEETKTSDFYSIHLGILEPLPENYAQYQVLRTPSQDSVGIVYATEKDIEKVQSQWTEWNWFWRAVFVLFSFVLIGFIFYMAAENLTAWKALAFQLLIVAVGWFVFNQINIAENWLPAVLQNLQEQDALSYQKLCNFAVDGIFFFIAAFTLQHKLARLRFQISSTSFFTAIFAAATGGLINVVAIINTINSCYALALDTTAPMLTLRLFPGIGTLLFYLVLGIILLALTISLIAVNQFLLRSCEGHFKLAIIICIATFIIGLITAQLYTSELFALTWASVIACIYFALIFTLSFVYSQFPYSLPHSSPLRNAATYSFVVAIVGSALIYQGKMQKIDRNLHDTLQTFSQTEDQRAEELTREILNSLQQQFESLTEEQIQERPSFIQSQFTQTIESIIQNEVSLYSFDLQFIDAEENLIADYSTNLNSPEWVSYFDLNQLREVVDFQQISKNNIRPIIQQPELANGESYQTFYRGWIPIFGINEYEPVAWILCSVFQERPNFDKPMRAVISSLTYKDWENSYTIQKYLNKKLTNTVYQGSGAQYPAYNVLQPAEDRALQQDSVIYYTSSDDSKTYRNLLAKHSENTVIKSSTMLPGYQTILFSFFRLSFTLLIVGFIVIIVYQWVKMGEFAFFGENERFQYRILDSFLLATLVFLISLIIVTHFALEQQNTNLAEEELFDKLESITHVIEESPAIPRQLSRNENVTLNSITEPLNVDVTLYRNRMMSQSTTPQIYQQNLLPGSLPYSVYSDLFLSQKRNSSTTVILDRQELLIGYRSVLSDEKQPIAVIAIPTFVQSPQFNRQLLETTSYLIILYLVVFGFFVIATTLISRQLTRPLYYIQQGLNKISKGNLDTTIPATSNDEIGGLAMAYNEMVSRLKELQKELAAAEREAAWKEMAQQVAHEIKNPLTPMKLNIQHLERQLASGEYTIEELKEKIKTITQNLTVQIQSLNSIASDFSKFSKPIEEEFTKVNINDIVHSVADLYNQDNHTSVETNGMASHAFVYGARDELRRVIINLVKNAHEAMPNGGAINLKTYRRRNSLFIEVEDNGQGISEEDKPKIFVPNFSTKSSGTGLGLAICKKVIEAHEGSISFASIEGEGTTFVIKLPLYSN